ncbi:hypothetical protein GCM10027290_06450 [Micromonospora sonneratiae]|uniref:Capsular polysaccharide biosynthesis protein n=1 Tax=Micromonospora sonneratiae TaxID=1184706 RepID=A0ABW3Y8Y9_9ACTN
MRFARTITGILLLTIGLPGLLVGGALWMVLQHRDASGTFSASLEKVNTPGHAVVVPDLDALLDRDIPFIATGKTRLRIAVRHDEGPAFIGLAPAAEVAGYLAQVPYVTVDRVAVTKGPLPVRLKPAMPVQASLPGPGTTQLPGPRLAAPLAQSFWHSEGYGMLDLNPADVRGRQLSLVIMRTDAEAGIKADVRAEVGAGWLDPTAWGLLAGGVVLSLLGVASLVWPVRPREVIFVVEPSQVPVLAARVGVSSLNDLGRPGKQRTDEPVSADSDPTPVEQPAERPVEQPADSGPVAGAAASSSVDGSGPVDQSVSEDVESGSEPVDRAVPAWPVESLETVPSRLVRSADLVAPSRPATLADLAPSHLAVDDPSHGGRPPVTLALTWPAPLPGQAGLVVPSRSGREAIGRATVNRPRGCKAAGGAGASETMVPRAASGENMPARQGTVVDAPPDETDDAGPANEVGNALSESMADATRRRNSAKWDAATGA